MRHSQRLKLSFLLMSFFIMAILSSVSVQSKEKSQDAVNGFTYKIIYPEEQENKSLGYYDFHLEYGKQQKISLVLFNNNDYPISVNVELNTAKTDSNGVIEYGESELKNDKSLVFPFDKLVHAPENVTINANQEKMIELDISPIDLESNLNGVIAGGIQLTVQKNESEEHVSKNKDSVINEFAYIIGVLMRVGDSTTIAPEIHLNDVRVSIKEQRPYLIFSIVNNKAAYMEDMSINVKVYNKSKQDQLFSVKKTEMRMAPNSIMEYAVDITDKRLNSGRYIADLEVIRNKTVIKKWEQVFTVTDNDVQAIQSLSPNQMSHTFWWIPIFLIGLLALAIGFFLYLKIKEKGVDTIEERKKES